MRLLAGRAWVVALMALVVPIASEAFPVPPGQIKRLLPFDDPVADAHRIETVMQDDAQILHRTEAEITATLRIMKDLGVTKLRVTANWMTIAPDASSKTKPAFDAANPAAYPHANWANLDRAARLAAQEQVPMMIDIGFYAPLWASQDAAGSARGIKWVDPGEFALFTEAVARRYDGTFVVPDTLTLLPRISIFTLWNEPNHPGFLMPQWNGTSPVSPDVYRPMLRQGYAAIKEARSDDTVVLVGGLSSTSRTVGTYTVAPLQFLRSLACVNAALEPLTTLSCADFERIPGDGWAHHPYSLRVLPWNESDANHTDDAMMGDLPNLVALLHELVDLGRVDRNFLDVWLTEYAYENKDPVWNKPWTSAEQAKLLQQAEYLAWLLPEIRSYPQFLLRDVSTQGALDYLAQGRNGRAPGSWQSGLYWEPGFYGGEAKPAAASFRLALLAMPPLDDEDGLKLWGHVRPAMTTAQVTIERRVDGESWEAIPTWKDADLDGTSILAFPTDIAGYFVRYAETAPEAEYRLVWASPTGPQYGPAELETAEHLFAS